MDYWIVPEGYQLTDVQNFSAFVYIITNRLTGQSYVGRKNTWVLQAGKRVPSTWKNYWGSSSHLKVDLEGIGKDAFDRRILHLCGSRKRADFLEIEELFKREVMRAKLPDGTPAYYNRTIAGKWFGEPDDVPEDLRPPKGRKRRDADPARRRWKLTDAEVDQIRTSTGSAASVGAQYGISRQAVHGIRAGKLRP